MGSVGKGYAVEMVCRAAEARGLTSALVSVGGNLRAIGTKPDGSQWTGGVENPWNASEVYTNTNSIFGSPINMSDLALVTSGDYQRYFVVDGKRYHHIIDPDTLWPAAYYNGVTVLCPDSGMADCLTTALFCMPLEEGQKLVESLDGVEAMWCTPDKQATTSSGWDSHLKKVSFTVLQANRFEWPPRALWPCSAKFHLLIYGSETPAAFLNHFLFAVLFIFHFLLELSDIMCYTAVVRKYTPWGFMKGAIPIWKRPKSTVAAALIRRKRTLRQTLLSPAAAATKSAARRNTKLCLTG